MCVNYFLLTHFSLKHTILCISLTSYTPSLSPLSWELQFWPWKHFTWLEIISNSVNYTFRWVQIVYGLGCRLFLLSAYIQSCSYLQSLPSLSRGFIKNIKSDILFHPFQQKQINLSDNIFRPNFNDCSR